MHKSVSSLLIKQDYLCKYVFIWFLVSKFSETKTKKNELDSLKFMIVSNPNQFGNQ